MPFKDVGGERRRRQREVSRLPENGRKLGEETWPSVHHSELPPGRSLTESSPAKGGLIMNTVQNP